MQAITVEFVGGALDGQLTSMPELRHQYQFPVQPALTVVESDADTEIEPTSIRYDLVFTLGHPSLSDQGHYRYELVP